MKTTLPMGGGFAGGLASSIGDAINTAAQLGAARDQAAAKGALMGAQTFQAEQQGNLANVKASDIARTLGLRDNSSYLAELDALQPGAGTIYRGGASADRLADTILALQKNDLFRQAANAIPESSTGLDRQNRYTAVASGKTYEPFNPVGDSGFVVNSGTGQIELVNPQMASYFGGLQQSKTDLNNANATQSRYKYDAGRGSVVDVQNATATPVIQPNGQPLPHQEKPMPTAAIKLQQENLDLIGTAASLNADLGSFVGQIEGGRLNLGAFANLWNKSMNGLGMSTEESRNLQSFEATLEKLRNDSLRLNKGVQTDGDAQRAWNELLANINDPGVVMQRLKEIQKINERALMLRMNMNDQMRVSYGLQPLDYDPYLSQPSAIAGPAQAGGGATVDPALLQELRRRAQNNPALQQKLSEMGY